MISIARADCAYNKNKRPAWELTHTASGARVAMVKTSKDAFCLRRELLGMQHVDWSSPYEWMYPDVNLASIVSKYPAPKFPGDYHA